MKIAILNNLYFPYERGGAEKVVVAQIAALQNSGQEVFVVTTKPYGSRPTIPGGPRVYYLESQYFSLGGWPLYLRPFWHLANIFSWRKYRRLRAILAAEQPDRVITHNLMGLGFMAPLAIRRLHLPQEHWLHDIQLLHPSGLMVLGQEHRVNGLGARLYQAAVRWLFASPKQVISPSRWLLSEHDKRGFFLSSEKSTGPWEKDSCPTAPTEGRRNFLFVGQIEDHKGILFLVNAFKKMAGNERRLVIVGDGQKMKAAQKLAGSDRRIEFRGRLSGAETKKAMAEAAWLIVPSLCYENYPTVIREAHAAGLPVIAAAIGGIPEMTSSADQLFRPGDEEDLLKALQEA